MASQRTYRRLMAQQKLEIVLAGLRGSRTFAANISAASARWSRIPLPGCHGERGSAPQLTSRSLLVSAS